MPSDTRIKMIDATVEALQRRGVAGMSFTDVLQHSGAARGAIYHHFPGGKTQIVTEAAARNGRDVRAALAALPAGSAVTVVEAFLATVRPVITESAAGGGCAVAAITMAAGAEAGDALRQVPAGSAGLAPGAGGGPGAGGHDGDERGRRAGPRRVTNCGS